MSEPKPEDDLLELEPDDEDEGPPTVRGQRILMFERLQALVDLGELTPLQAQDVLFEIDKAYAKAARDQARATLPSYQHPKKPES